MLATATRMSRVLRHSTFILLLVFRRAICLTSSSASSHGLPSSFEDIPSLRVVSFNNNGGNVRIVDFFSDKHHNINTTTDEKRRLSMRDPRMVLRSLQIQVVSALRSTFLPSGYPTRTPPGYLNYSMWSWAQDLSTQLRSVLATQRILGVGVGREGATALSALFNYLVRDGFGMVATLLFTYAASSRFRTDCKRWRIFADISVDVGITLEVAATLLPAVFFLPMICLGNVFKAMCGVAAGACAGSINLHWAKGSDISDINAKFGAQHTVTAALGLVFAGIFARYVNRVSSKSLWLLYAMLTFLHIYANLRCMRLISFDYLNKNRMDMVMEKFFDDSEELPTPAEIAQVEPLWFVLPILKQRLRINLAPSVLIRLGLPFDEFYEGSMSKSFDEWKVLFENETPVAKDSYLISIGTRNKQVAGAYTVDVCFLANASYLQQTKAYFHAKLLSRKLEEECRQQQPGMDRKHLQSITEDAQSELETLWTDFVCHSINAGWDLERSELETNGYEIQIEGEQLMNRQ